jgi:3-polyprenyl-4-hydroxybenzoate decarboxylase
VTESWVRSQRASAVDLGSRGVVLVATDGSLRRLDGPSADLARAVLEYLAVTRSRADIVAHIETLAGPIADPGVIDQLIALFAETRTIGHPRLASRGIGANVVVGVSGALAASHAPAFVSALQRRGHTVEIALTATASRFVAIDALRAIVAREPHVSPWPRSAHDPVPHVALAQWAELVVVYPASATTIGRIANGDFSDLVAATALTTRAPVIVVPSMNADMLASPAVQRNLELLRDDGRAIIAGVPAEEAADAPSVRDPRSSAAPAPAEVAATIDVLLATKLLVPPARSRDWDAAYRRATPSDTCDPDIIAALAAHAPPPRRLLDIGCGAGAIARHAARAGYRVVATDLSEVALSLARRSGDDGDIIWLRDDICASSLAGPFEIVVDRASLHTLPAARWHAWAHAIRRLASDVVIVKAHRDGTATTTGWSGRAIGALLPDFEVIVELATTLPHPHEPAMIPSVVVVLRRVLSKY